MSEEGQASTRGLGTRTEGPGRGLESSPSELIQQIRFALDQLGEQNGHFVFERICFVFARRRLSRYLLPPTGPVAAGGDQGRDGESFWTQLPDPATGLSSSLSAGALVLACTTQKDSITTKITDDIGKIVARGTPVDRIAYFSVAAVPVAIRHRLQEDARADHNIELEIFDAVALAEHLADPDLFWAASEYLKIPASFAPTVTEGEAVPDWYAADLAALRSGRSNDGYSYGRFVTVRDVSQYATFNTATRGDLAEVVPILVDFAERAVDPEVRQRARYEIAVAAMRGEENLRPHDERVRSFFAALRETPSDIPLLHDAVTLLTYVFGAWATRLTELRRAELEEWYRDIEDFALELLSSSTSPNRSASLRSLLARLYLMPALPNVEIQRTPGNTGMAVNVEPAGEFGVSDSSILPFDVPLRDATQALQLIEQILDGRDDTPTFPVASIARTFDFVDLTLSLCDDYSRVRAKLDAAVSAVEGADAIATRSYRRATALLESGRLVEATSELHTAATKWWRGDAVPGSVQMMLLASRVYGQLGMALAGKQLALAAAAAAWTTIPRSHELFAEALLEAASSDYFAGQWVSSAHLFARAFTHHGEAVEHPLDLDRHEVAREGIQILNNIIRAATDFVPEYLPLLQPIIGDGDNLPGDSTARNDELTPDWWSIEGVARRSDETGIGRPFSDVGTERLYRWTYRGRSWTVVCPSQRPQVLAAERLIAALQIFQVAIAKTPVVWAPGDFYLEVGLAAGEASIDAIPDSSHRRWRIGLAEAGEDPIEHWNELTLVILEFALLNSLTPEDELRSVLERAMEHGLLSRLRSGRPYDELADLIDDYAYAELSEATPSPFLRPDFASPTGTSEISTAPEPPLPYDRDLVLETIRERYDTAAAAIPHTIARTKGDERLATVVKEFREEGWLDWQILAALFNAVGNSRLQREGREPQAEMSVEELQSLAELMRRPELEGDPPPLDEFLTIDGFRQMLFAAVFATLESLGLEAHGNEDPERLCQFLGTYYRYFEDDVEHRDYFDAGD